MNEPELFPEKQPDPEIVDYLRQVQTELEEAINQTLKEVQNETRLNADIELSRECLQAYKVNIILRI